ncbi:hypothetical protein BH09PSE4_BH09PSE4_22200 [soil metagenome]
MQGCRTDSRIHRRLIDSLYVEAMLLADEARGYFDEVGRVDRDLLDPMRRVAFSCESLKVTTRLMHVIAWLLTQRAVEVGELRPRDALDPARRLGPEPETEDAVFAAMPVPAQALIEASAELFRRVALLDGTQGMAPPLGSPVQSMQDRLAAAF